MIESKLAIVAAFIDKIGDVSKYTHTGDGIVPLLMVRFLQTAS